LEYDRAKIVIAVRESSLSKPAVKEYRSKGVEIRTFDLDNFELADAVKLFEGVDTVITAFYYTYIRTQYPLIEAAKKAGVKRFVPCDWATPCVRGVRGLFDTKLAVREHLQGSGVGYTFIDVGWWMQLLLPVHNFEASIFSGAPQINELLKPKYGSYDTRTATTDIEDIGKFVARIVDDPRTLDHYVFCWGDEVTQGKVVETVNELSPVKFDFVFFSKEEILQDMKRGKAANDLSTHHLEYSYSLWVREDNLVEKAKKAEYGGALDARELYPDFTPKSFREVAEAFYRA